jgi:hypothetical protein
MLLEAGATVDGRCKGWSRVYTLHNAADNAHAEVCRVLIAAGAAVLARGCKQYTPSISLQKIENGHAQCRVLLGKGVQSNSRCTQLCSAQASPLHLAAIFCLGTMLWCFWTHHAEKRPKNAIKNLRKKTKRALDFFIAFFYKHKTNSTKQVPIAPIGIAANSRQYPIFDIQ